MIEQDNDRRQYEQRLALTWQSNWSNSDRNTRIVVSQPRLRLEDFSLARHTFERGPNGLGPFGSVNDGRHRLKELASVGAAVSSADSIDGPLDFFAENGHVLVFKSTNSTVERNFVANNVEATLIDNVANRDPVSRGMRSQGAVSDETFARHTHVNAELADS